MARSNIKLHDKYKNKTNNISIYQPPTRKHYITQPCTRRTPLLHASLHASTSTSKSDLARSKIAKKSPGKFSDTTVAPENQNPKNLRFDSASEKQAYYSNLRSTTKTIRLAATVPHAPRLGTALDCASDDHVFTHVNHKRPCNVDLIGANTSKHIDEMGDYLSLEEVLLHKNTPANLCSMSRLLSKGPWDSLCFQRHRKNRNFHDVWGINHATRARTLVAFRDPRKSSLYQMTQAGLDYNYKRKTALLTIGGTNDIHEKNKIIGHLRRLIYPAPSTASKMNKHSTIHGFSFTPTATKNYKSMSHESRLAGSMKGPIYRKSKHSGRTIDINTIKYLDVLYGDSTDLATPGPNGEKYIFNMIDLKTGYPWSIPHKDFTSLPDLLERKLNKILDHARFTVGIEEPSIKRFYIDGHPSQKSNSDTTIAAMEKMLQRRHIHTPPISPGDHKQMGLIERYH